MPAIELEDRPLEAQTREEWETTTVLSNQMFYLPFKAPADRVKSDSDFRCLVARSALVSHFSYSTVYQGNLQEGCR